MAVKTLWSVFNDEGKHIQALSQTMPRSFKMHVWANYKEVDGLGTTELIYLGTIQPYDQTDTIEVETLVRELALKEL